MLKSDRFPISQAVVILTLGFGVSLITSTVVAPRAYRDRGDQQVRVGQSISVKGSTRQRITSDRAVWSIIVKGKGATLKQAFEVLETSAAKVQAFLLGRGFGEGEVGCSAIHTETHYVRNKKGETTQEVEGYTLSRTFGVTTGDVDRVNASAGKVTELIKEDVLVISGRPEYYYTELADLKIQLMAAASADARSRAEKIATAAGCRVGELRAASMGVLQITEPYSTEVSSYGMYDTSTILKDVRAVVTAEFAIEAS